LGNIPLGNPVVAQSEVWSADFELEKCNQCGFIQTVNKVPFEKLAEENYYVSSVSEAVLRHYEWMLGYIEKFDEVKKEDLVLEIGCGDGALLNILNQAGYKNLIGVEPNKYEVKNKKYELINDFFSADVALSLKNQGKFPKLIILNSVIETIPDLGNFFKELFQFMNEGTLFFIEVPHFVAYFNNRRIDAFSHLTSNWFTVSFFNDLAKNYHFEMIDVSIDTYRGGSIYLMGKKESEKSSGFAIPELIQKIINEEKEVLNDASVEKFRVEINQIKTELNEQLSNFIAKGFTVSGYGGGLKASTLLNWLDASMLDFVVDKDPYKIGKFIPRLNIPILGIEALRNKEAKKVVINLAINFKEEVEKSLFDCLENGDVIVHLFPKIEFVEVTKKLVS
jgi:novobiocin biosynthesis protein NovU/D-mycarose 3-C-methyltransferase